MHYCVTEGDIDMIINEWPDEWRIPTIPRGVSGQTTEGGVAQAETASTNPSTQETKNEPTQDDSGRWQLRAARDP
jgi:hypothetical protein